MAPDYTKYSLAQLEEALQVVDANRYPENKAAIEAEIQARKDSGEYDREIEARRQQKEEKRAAEVRFAQTAVPVIGWYLIVTGSWNVLSQIFWPPSTSSMAQFAIVSAGVVYMLGTIFGGIVLLRRRTWAPALVMGLLCVQVVSFSSTAFSIKVLSALGVYITFAAGGDVGIAGNLNFGFWFSMGQPQPLSMGINLFVAWLIYLVFVGTKPATPPTL